MSLIAGSVSGFAVGNAPQAGGCVNGQKLTEETKKKLLALGIDVSGIITEEQGQEKLRQVQAKNAFQPFQNPQRLFGTLDGLANYNKVSFGLS